MRRSHLPAPVKIDLLHGSLARLDSTWSTFSGVVHAAREQAGHTILKMGTGATEVNVQIPALIHGADLIDKEVSATGVFGPLFNERRQAIGHQIFVPSAQFLVVADSAALQPAPSTIESLRRYRPNADERHSVVVKGTVVLRSAADTIFVQDHTAGIEVRGPVRHQRCDQRRAGSIERARGRSARGAAADHAGDQRQAGQAGQ